MFLAAFALVNTVADARPQTGSLEEILASVVQQQAPARQRFSDYDASSLRSALDAARRGDRGRWQAASQAMGDEVARKIAQWAFVDASGEQLAFFELDQARRDLAGWPRPGRRQQLAEKRIEDAGYAPQGIVDWFGSDAPQTAEGAMALAAAYRATGKEQQASTLLRAFWRGKVFEADLQRAFLQRFGDVLTPEDHALRADFLLYGPQGPAARDMLPLLDGVERAKAEARIALRNDARNASDLVSRLPAGMQNSGGVMFERAAWLRRRGLDDAALAMVPTFGFAPGHEDGDTRVWTERRQLINIALRNQDYRSAYAAASNHGLTSPVDLTDAEFYAGWLALSKLNNPKAADEHFARIQAAGSSPITQGRALYWRGRAHEAMGDSEGARGFYSQGARHYTTFYGQLAAEKAGVPRIVLGNDPVIDYADSARFEGRDIVRAARILAEAGQSDLFRQFVLHIDDVLPNAAEYALLVDLARGYGDQDLGMRVVRTAAQKGYILPERGYPLRSPPNVASSAEAALIFGIVRQESGFDPRVRSGAGARGMMQLMPATAQVVARQSGMSYSASMLDDPDYNMRLGMTYIGQMIDQFNGSYVLAIAAYNAGPGRPREWITFCGDPRSGGDPLDFIECIPFSETRNYVMRVMEGMGVYRARLSGGATAPTLAVDLRRGGYPTGYVASNP